MEDDTPDANAPEELTDSRFGKTLETARIAAPHSDRSSTPRSPSSGRADSPVRVDPVQPHERRKMELRRRRGELGTRSRGYLGMRQRTEAFDQDRQDERRRHQLGHARGERRRDACRCEASQEVRLLIRPGVRTPSQPGASSRRSRNGVRPRSGWRHWEPERQHAHTTVAAASPMRSHPKRGRETESANRSTYPGKSVCSTGDGVSIAYGSLPTPDEVEARRSDERARRRREVRDLSRRHCRFRIVLLHTQVRSRDECGDDDECGDPSHTRTHHRATRPRPALLSQWTPRPLRAAARDTQAGGRG